MAIDMIFEWTESEDSSAGVMASSLLAIIAILTVIFA